MPLLSILKKILDSRNEKPTKPICQDAPVQTTIIGEMGDMMISAGEKTLLLVNNRTVGLWMTEGAYDYCHVSDEYGHEHMRNYLIDNLDELYKYLLIPSHNDLYLLNITDSTNRGGWIGSEPFWSTYCAEMIDVFRSIIFRFVKENTIDEKVSLIIVCSSKGTSAGGRHLSQLLKEEGFKVSIVVQQFSEMFANSQCKKYQDDITFYKENFDTTLVDESAYTKRPSVTSFGSLLETFNDYRYELIRLAKEGRKVNCTSIIESLKKEKTQCGEPFPMISRTANVRLNQYGQVRTLVDIVKHLNQQNQYTNLDTLLSDFNSVLEKYRSRGTIDNDVITFTIGAIKSSFGLHSETPYLDFNRFISFLDYDTCGDDIPTLDAIYSRRAKTKLIRLVEILNEIRRYTNSDELINDLTEVVSNEEMDDPFLYFKSYPRHFFLVGLKSMWNEMTTDGVLNNDLLEDIIFTNHEKRLQTYELRCLIGMDFEDDGPCHPEVYFPKQLGTAPIYVEYPFISEGCSSTPILVKSCGEGKGPNRSPELYEFEVVRRIIERECELGNYVDINGHYIPVYDYRLKKVVNGWYLYPQIRNTRPVFNNNYGRIRFRGEREKCRYINKIIGEAKYYDIWKSLEKKSR